ncbi:MAG: MerC domain-containing protein [Microscillaceae bacterium]|jgi:hypothetical protein|nr:MerC domain-containing protein [Microscillaceae bacterium]
MTKIITTLLQHRYDYLGIIGSGVCLVHCLLPTLLLLVNINLIETPFFNYVFLVISFIAVFNVTYHQRQWYLTAWLWGAFGLTALGVLFEDDLPGLEYLLYISTLALIVGHIRNIRHNQHCHACENDD